MDGWMDGGGTIIQGTSYLSTGVIFRKKRGIDGVVEFVQPGAASH